MGHSCFPVNPSTTLVPCRTDPCLKPLFESLCACTHCCEHVSHLIDVEECGMMGQHSRSLPGGGSTLGWPSTPQWCWLTVPGLPCGQ